MAEDDEGQVETVDLVEESEVASVQREVPREQPAALSALSAVREVLSTVRNHHDAARNYVLKCPQCGGMVARQEGCLHCANHCGWGAC